MKKLLFFLIIVLNTNLIASTFFEAHEVKIYTPQKNAVSDLIYEIRMDKLAENLSKNPAMGKIPDIYFKVYWSLPSDYKIEVFGIPDGFVEMKASLIGNIKNLLEIVLPMNIEEKFKGYTLSEKIIENKKIVQAIDETNTLNVNQMNIELSDSGMLKSIETFAPMSKILTSYNFGIKSWSKNKYLLDRSVTSTKQGFTNYSSITTIEYLDLSGVGFPQKITNKNLSETIIPAHDKVKEKKIKSENITIYRLSNFEVNTGKAKKVIFSTH